MSRVRDVRDNAMSNLVQIDFDRGEWVGYHTYSFSIIHKIGGFGGSDYHKHLESIFFGYGGSIPLRTFIKWWYNGFSRSGSFSRMLG